MQKLFGIAVVGLILGAVIVYGLNVPMWNLVP